MISTIFPGKMRSILLFLVAALAQTATLTAASTCPPSSTIWYVDASAPAGGTGTSWECAFDNLHSAIEASSSGHQIWVKAGIYMPAKDGDGVSDPADSRQKTFNLKDGVKLYGGFHGTETSLDQRNWNLYVTTLSGDIGVPGNDSDNCYHVVMSVYDFNANTEINGFTITGGNADGTVNYTVEFGLIYPFNGGGVYKTSSAASVVNCTITDNYAETGGGGMICWFQNTHSTISNCIFSNNSVDYSGNALSVRYCSATFNNCIITNNQGTSIGNAIVDDDGNATFNNCLFVGNTANGGAGITILSNSNAIVRNCTFSGNYNYFSGAGTISVNYNSSVTISNSIVWNNKSGNNIGTAYSSLSESSAEEINITYSLLQGHMPAGTGNLDGITFSSFNNYPGFSALFDPGLAPGTGGDFHLLACSPVADAGTATNAPATDLDGAARPFGPAVDLGCYERQSAGTPPSVWYADADGDSYGDPGSSTTFCTQLNGYVGNNTDCDDNDPLEHPGQTWYADLDNDGYSSGVTQVSCLRPAGHKVASEMIAPAGDCNDNNAAIKPGATEVCDNIDNNCNGMTDEGLLTTYYRDMDGDGFGNPTNTTQACSLPSGYVTNNTDCDDNDEDINPEAIDVCDGIDNNCDGNFDDGVLATYYRDMDGDSFGNPSNTTQACSQPSGYVTNNTDCDDNNAAIKPNAAEVCDGVDNDCDGLLDGNDPNFVDTTPPTVSCPGIQTLVLNTSCNAALPDYRNLATANDACGTYTLTQMPAPGANVSGQGLSSVTITASDGHNNSKSCTFSVSKLDQTPPSAICRQGTIQLSGTQSFLEADDVLDFNASSDNCGQVLVTDISPASINCSLVDEIISVNVSVSDGNGNSASCVANLTVTKENVLPEPWHSENIGVTAQGTSEYDLCSNTGGFTLQAQGYTTNILDVQHSVYQDMCGDAELIVQVGSILPQGGWAGIQMRESDSQGARKFTLKTQLSTMLRREIRLTTFGATNTQQTLIPPTHTWLRITRTGNVFTGYSSTDGINWVFRSSATFAMPGCVQVGMFVESINNTTVTQAIFSNVSISGGVLPLAVLPDTPTANAYPAVDVEKIHEFTLPFQPKPRVYPNPTTGEVNVDLEDYMGRAVRIEVYNMLGQQMHFVEIDKMQAPVLRVDLSEYQAGAYLIRLATDGAQTVTMSVYKE